MNEASLMISEATSQDAYDPGCNLGLFDTELQDEPGAASDVDPARRAQIASASIHPAPSATMAETALKEWIEAIVDRDERALTAMYDATMLRVYGFVLRVVRRRALAEEVVEDTFFQVWRQAARFDPERGPALSWLLGMARSRAIDAVRREARFQHDEPHDDLAHDVEDSKAQADDLLNAARDHADLQRALMVLNAQARQLVALAFFKGMSHEEIARQTSLPLGTVKTQIRRALLTLRKTLGDGGLTALTS